MYPGYASRIELELKKIYIEKILKNVQNKNIKIPINIVDSPRRKYSVFAGAAILSTAMESTGVEDYWISKKEWEECGSKIIMKKCKNILK
jgi:actin-related protein